MRRVLHVMNSLERSGMEMMLLNSCAEWRRFGYECDILATAKAIGPLADQLRANGYGVFHLPFRSRLRYLPEPSFIPGFYRICKSGYDVLHIHTETAHPLLAVIAKLAGVRRIAVTLHGIFNFRNALRARKFCERHAASAFGCRFGVISEAVRMCEWDRFRIRGIRILNWLDTSHFKPPTIEQREGARQSMQINNGRFVITSVGNCSSLKNHPTILRALSLLPPEVHPLYLHVGREEPGAPERRLAAALGIEDEVRFLESQSDPLPFLWAADAFVMPSLNEGLGMSAIEAVAAGVPLVCSAVEGLSDVAAETKWSIQTSTSPESVAEGLAKVAEIDATERRVRAVEDSSVIRDRYSIESGVRSVVEQLYA